jgi:hypothetical protein
LNGVGVLSKYNPPASSQASRGGGWPRSGDYGLRDSGTYDFTGIAISITPRPKVFKNYMQSADEDEFAGGWWEWAKAVYGDTWRKIQEISDETDSSFK